MINKITPFHINQGFIVLIIFDAQILMEILHLFHLFEELNNPKKATLTQSSFTATLLVDALLDNYSVFFKEGQTTAINFLKQHWDFWREHYPLSNLNKGGNTDQNSHVQLQKHPMNFQNTTSIYTFHEWIQMFSLVCGTITLYAKITLSFIITFSKCFKIYMLT